MSTSEVSLPPAILQDLLRLQGEELIRLRSKVEEYSQVIDLLRRQLQDVRSENERLRAGGARFAKQDAGKKTATCVSPELDVANPGEDTFDQPIAAWVQRDDNPWPEADSAEFTQPPPSESTTSTPAGITISASDNQSQGLHVSPFEAPKELKPFCVHKGPWKVLDQAKKAVPKPRSYRFMIGENNLVFSATSPNIAFLILPVPTGRPHMKNIEKQIKKSMNKERAELIVFQKGKSIYAGTYEARESAQLETRLFPNLPKIVKEEVYKLSKGEGFVDSFVRSSFANGEWKVVQIKYERIGFNQELNQLLFSASTS